jgi:hypothetical protein
MIRDLQTSGRIREHINELNEAFNISKNKELLDEHIELWEDRFNLKIEQEKQLEIQLKQQQDETE